MSKIRAGIVGCGGIANGKHLPSIKATGEVDLVAFCDIVRDRAEAACKTYGIEGAKVYEDYKELLKDDTIEAVYVCTPNRSHSFISIDALNAGKHVMCEKPMAKTYAEAVQMVEAAKRNNKILTIGYQNRRSAASLYIKQAAEAGDLGEIYYAKAHAVRRRAVPTWGVFLNEEEQGGGPLIDLGVHVIDLCRYLMGGPQPVSVYGATFNKLGDRRHIKDARGYSSTVVSKDDIFDVEDMATALIRFDNGAVLSVEASFSLNIEKDVGNIELFGTKAGCKLDPELTIFTDMNDYLANVKLAQSTALSFDGLFDNEINHFVECIETGKPCRNPAQDGVTLMKILDGIYESARTGHEVLL